jgi:hypothetical protein
MYRSRGKYDDSCSHQVESLRQVKEVFGQFRVIITNMEAELEQKIKSQAQHPPKVQGSPRSDVCAVHVIEWLFTKYCCSNDKWNQITE